MAKMALQVLDHFNNQWTRDLPNDQYHRDKTSISSSSLRQFLRSPAHFHEYLVGEKAPPTPAMITGTMVHSLVLEPERFRAEYVVMPDFPLRSKLGKAMHERWCHENRDKNVIREADMQMLVGIAKSLVSNPTIVKMLKASEKEVSGYYRDPVTGLKCRIRPDAIARGGEILLDFKTTKDASYDAFTRSIVDFRYDIQLAMYEQGIKEITGAAPVTTAIIAVEKTPPYSCAVYEMTEGILSTGNLQYRQALDGIKRCLERDEWPQYFEGAPQKVFMPDWFVNKVQSKIEQEGT